MLTFLALSLYGAGYKAMQKTYTFWSRCWTGDDRCRNAYAGISFLDANVQLAVVGKVTVTPLQNYITSYILE